MKHKAYGKLQPIMDYSRYDKEEVIHWGYAEEQYTGNNNRGYYEGREPDINDVLTIQIAHEVFAEYEDYENSCDDADFYNNEIMKQLKKYK